MSVKSSSRRPNPSIKRGAALTRVARHFERWAHLMLDIFLARDIEDIDRERLPVRLSLGGALYWFLHRYFVHADLEPGNYSFLNPYEDTQLNGYQLHRLKTELEQALTDLSAYPGTFKVLVGWTGTRQSVESEDWKEVERESAETTIKAFLDLINEAAQKGWSLWAIGD